MNQVRSGLPDSAQKAWGGPTRGDDYDTTFLAHDEQREEPKPPKHRSNRPSSKSTHSRTPAGPANPPNRQYTSASTDSALPPKLRTPASIADTRFEKKREMRKARCSQCGELKGGNASGAFCHRKTMPLAAERKAAWECGDWGATWYCTECYMRYYNFSYEAVIDMLGFTEGAAKTARYVNLPRLCSSASSSSSFGQVII